MPLGRTLNREIALRGIQQTLYQSRRLGSASTMSADAATLPVHEGYMMPAEWNRHERTWMGWPQREDNWKDKAGPGQQAFADVANAISTFEPVTVCANGDQLAKARSMLGAGVSVEELPQDDAWFRDMGPTFLLKGNQLGAADWQFNAWGLGGWLKDEQAAREIIRRAGARCFSADFVLEGGSIHVDGEGSLLTTEECLLHENRNPSLSKAEIEQRLKDFTGASKVIWLPKGLTADDDTKGHVDNIACFCCPGKVLLAWPSTDDADQLERSEAALQVLEATTDAKGRKLEIVKLPVPPPMFYEKHEELSDASGKVTRPAGARLAGSYVNFYLCNGGLICAAFGGVAKEADARAKEILQAQFPDRKIVQISTARDILLGGGNIHCITQQQPAVG